MHSAPDDAAYRVVFKFRGDRTFRLPVEMRPVTLGRALFLTCTSIIVWGGLWSVPVAFVQPGPVGALLTAVAALTLGIATGVMGTLAIERFDTPERPLLYNIACLMSETRAERPAPENEDEELTTSPWSDTDDELESEPMPILARSHRADNHAREAQDQVAARG